MTAQSGDGDGVLSCDVVSGAEVRNVRVDGVIALDALYFAVRDDTWGTVSGTLASSHDETDGSELRRHSEWVFRSDTVHIRTALVMTVGSDRVSLEATSVAVGSQTVRRVGMCLLHPLELRGAEVLLQHGDGSTESSVFPAEISPHQPFLDLTGLTERLPGAGDLDIAFEGGLFETEDHRNWTDAGWKTYSPPLDEPSPIRLADGDRLRQLVTLTAVPALRPAANRSPAEPSSIHVEIGGMAGAVLPLLGAGVSGRPAPATAPARLSFLSCELQDDADGPARLDAAVAEARHNRLPLFVLLSCTASRLDEWAGLLRAAAGVVTAVTVVDPESRVTPSGTAERVRELLAGTAIRAGAGTRGYGAELGRAREPFVGADFLQVSASAMVHHSDDERVMDTVRAYPDLLRLARSRAGSAPLVIAPITIAQRLTLHDDPFGPYAPYAPGFRADPRTSTSFGAAWAIGVIAGAAGAEALSFFWSGPDGGFEHAGAPSPATEVLGRLAAKSGAALLQATTSDPRSVAALAWRYEDGTSVVCLANLRGRPQHVTVGNNSSSLQLDPYGVVEMTLDG